MKTGKCPAMSQQQQITTSADKTQNSSLHLEPMDIPFVPNSGICYDFIFHIRWNNSGCSFSYDKWCTSFSPKSLHFVSNLKVYK